jgi:hypothetical protein
MHTDQELYDLAPDPDAKPAGAAGAHPSSMQTIPYLPVTARDLQEYDATEGSAARNLYLPIALVLLGCAAVTGRMLYFRLFSPPELAAAWRWVGFMLGWNVLVMLGGVYGIARFTGISFGPLSTAVIKLAAIAVAPHAVMLIVEVLLAGDFAGVAVGWLLAIPLAWWLFMHLFNLDAQEALICVGVTACLRWLSYLVYWLS